MKTSDGGASWVEEEKAEIKGQKVEVRLNAVPNPFVSFTSVLGHEKEKFALYDISGRKVGVYRGDRVGEGLAPGVYFLRPEGRSSRPVRIVKIR
jgi:hypothetical protein